MLPRLHRRRAVRRLAAARARAAAREHRARQPALDQPDLGGEHRAGRARPRARARVLQRLAGRVRRDLHAERDRRAAAGRRGVPVPARRPLPAHLRQPQLGQRHPRVRARPRRRDDLRAERGARPARRRGPAAALPERDRRRSPQPVRLPGAVELLRRPAPARVDRAGARARLGRAARRRRVRADQPARPRAAGTRTSSRSRSTRCSASRPASAACSPAATRSPSSSARGSPAARSSPRSCSASTTTSRPAPRTSRTAPSTTSTCRPSRSACASSTASASTTIHARVGALGALAARRRSRRCATATARRRPRSTGRDHGERRGATIAFNFLHPDGRVVDERYVDRVAGRHNISLRTGCFCNPGAGEIAFTISRETLLGGEFGARHDPRRLHQRDRAALRRRDPRVARAGVQLRTSIASWTSPRSSSTSPARRTTSPSAALLTSVTMRMP